MIKETKNKPMHSDTGTKGTTATNPPKPTTTGTPATNPPKK